MLKRTTLYLQQPFGCVAFTEKIYGWSGFGTTINVGLVTPLFHKKLPGPLATTVAAEPEQISVLPVITGIGAGFTTTLNTLLALQPLTEEPVTVNGEVAAGVTLMAELVEPLLQE